jgi:hypothetical protein
MKTSELTGAALDWAVAKSLGLHVTMTRGCWFVFDSDAFSEFRNDYNDDKLQSFRPSTDWAQGGPIIEREGISVLHTTMRPSHAWEASHTPDEDLSVCEFGPTPLIAAMQCYVASKLGDEVDVPEELK